MTGSHGHGHGHASSASGRHLGRLRAAFAVIAVFFVVQAGAGVVTGSLALISDAAHMATDVGGLGMALAAITFAARGSTSGGRTYGMYRLEILAALANAVLLFAVAGYVLVEAIGRWGDPPDLPTGWVLVAGIVGLAANLVAFAILRPAAGESVNLQGAYLEVLADTVGSVAVIAGAVVITLTGWTIVDPLVGAGIGLWILPRTWRLAASALRVLIQAAPAHLDLDALAGDLAGIDTVVDVHDLHVWTLTTDMDVASAHLVIRSGADAHAVLDQARVLLTDRYHLAHATLQVEPDDHTGCDEISW